MPVYSVKPDVGPSTPEDEEYGCGEINYVENNIDCDIQNNTGFG